MRNRSTGRRYPIILTAVSLIASIAVYGRAAPLEMGDPAAAIPRNLAPLAAARATSEQPENFEARFAVDGRWVGAGSGPSGAEWRNSWAVDGAKANDKADFTLTWKSPQTVGEIVYFGRTASFVKETSEMPTYEAMDLIEGLAKKFEQGKNYLVKHWSFGKE